MSTVMNVLESYEEIWKTGLVGIMAIIGLFLLAGILKQIKKLNGNLKSITANMQAYFDVILKEEEGAEEKISENEAEIRAKIENLKKREEDEKLFNAVLREYFS